MSFQASSENPKGSPKRRRWGRAILVTLAVPVLLAVFLGLSTAYRIYASNWEIARERLPAISMPQSSQRLLVFSPHPDDETLGAAGMMREARLRGCDVHVVFLTCGDGFRVGASRTLHVLTVTPSDYVRYGEVRQVEARTALSVLGIPANHVTFLGYPDQGLMPLWTTHWNRLYTSPYTRADHSPYPDAATPDAAYEGASVLADVKKQMLLDHPTDIYITHPSDDHPDHAAGSVFVRTALQTAHLHYYLVHRGDWPVPEGLYENAALPPPAPMADLDTNWEKFRLTPYDVKRKYAAIKRYQSQTEMMGRFLFSFARRNELFGTLTDDHGSLPVVPDGRMRVDGRADDWAGLAPLDDDGIGDTVVRAFERSGDITHVWACRDSKNLYVRVDTNGNLSSRVRYAVTLRPVKMGIQQPTSLYFTLYPRSSGHSHPIHSVPGATYVWRGSLLETVIPLPKAGLANLAPDESLYFSAETRFAGIPVDKTGFRGLTCGPTPAALTASR
jgi:LmbE family N-acetylglucosaminyl deacetylase